jgi:hypothetical protein
MFGCSGDDEPAMSITTVPAAPSTATTAPPEPTTTSSIPCTADDAEPNRIEHLVVDEIEGFQLQAGYVGGTGPVDLLQAVRDDGQPDAHRVLTDLRFRRGYQRLWRNQFGEELVVFLYEFCDGAGATAYSERETQMLLASGEIEPFATDSSMAGYVIERENVVAAFVDAWSGPLLVHVTAYARPSTGRQEVQARATTLVERQLALL